MDQLTLTWTGFQKPKRLVEAAWATSQRVAMGRMPQGEQANVELLAYLLLGAAALKGGESLLRPKVQRATLSKEPLTYPLGHI